MRGHVKPRQLALLQLLPGSQWQALGQQRAQLAVPPQFRYGACLALCGAQHHLCVQQ
jgi:hypothetical protein